jgi:superfamily I DNA and/or RNA helicase
VDGFQGREKDVILFSAVRTTNIGFLDDAKRLNVMLTRAKRGLIILGCKEVLCRDAHWKNWLKWVEQNNLEIDLSTIETYQQNNGKPSGRNARGRVAPRGRGKLHFYRTIEMKMGIVVVLFCIQL